MRATLTAAALAAAMAFACLPAAAQDTAAAARPGAGPAAVDGARISAADQEPGQWLTYGRTYDEQRFSPLDRIDAKNVDKLGLAWFTPMKGQGVQQESSPLYIDGVLYVTMPWSKVRAIDARTGAVLWDYDPKVPGEWGVNACCGMVNRGVAAWSGKIYVGTLDGRLVALDAKTGAEVWSVRTTPESEHYSITGAPRAAKGLVFIGNGGAELGVRGFVSAYDAGTGALVWRFYTVPRDPALGQETPALEMAAKTWDGKFWSLGGGGTVWDSIVYDPVTDLLFVGVGNGSPWDAEIRSPGGGDNLFLSSIVALKPETGEYVWHFQTTPNETWDYTASQPIMLADLDIPAEDGAKARRRVLMQAPKNGFFYVLDAATGAFISGESIVPVSWAYGLDRATGRPIPNPEARFDRIEGGAAWVTPGPAGGHSWHAMAFSPRTGLVYIPARFTSWRYKAQPDFKARPMGTNTAVDVMSGVGLEPPEELRHEAGGSLLAWDPVAQRPAWEVPHPEEGPNGGVLATAGGLVFQGTGSGEFAAYDASSGKKLWSASTQTGVAAPPITYELDGEQYVAVVAGRAAGGYFAPNYARLLVYKLGGKAELPAMVDYAPPPLAPPSLSASPEMVAAGERIYSGTCSTCHGQGAAAPGMFPDLRYSGALADPGVFATIVLGGARSSAGMVSFAKLLTPDDAESVRAYLISQAIAAKAVQDAKAAEKD